MLVLVLLLLILPFPTSSYAKKGGKGNGGGNDPPAVLPNVRFRADLIPASSFPRAINNLGMVVGNGPTIYDHLNDVLYELNELPALTAQLDPDVVFSSARGINDRVDIVGGVIDTLTGEQNGYLIDTSPDDMSGFDPDPTVWTVELLPDFSTQEYGKHINQNGDVLGIYFSDGKKYAYLYNPWLPVVIGQNPLPLEPDIRDISFTTALNNLGQVAGLYNGDGSVFFFDPASSSYTFSSEESYAEVMGLNDDGVFCGAYWKGQFGVKAFRYDAQLEPIIDGVAKAINADGDVLLESKRRVPDWATSYLLYAGNPDFPEQLVNIDELVVGDAATLTLWLDNRHFLGSMSQRGPTGFSQVIGSVRDSAGVTHGVVLTPFIPIPE